MPVKPKKADRIIVFYFSKLHAETKRRAEVTQQDEKPSFGNLANLFFSKTVCIENIVQKKLFEKNLLYEFHKFVAS